MTYPNGWLIRVGANVIKPASDDSINHNIEKLTQYNISLGHAMASTAVASLRADMLPLDSGTRFNTSRQVSPWARMSQEKSTGDGLSPRRESEA